MGRSALGKVTADRDLSGFFIESLEALVGNPDGAAEGEKTSGPFDAAALFGREAPLEVEVGSGKGMFLADAAAAMPERNFLGIEVSKKYSRFAAAQLQKAGLTNARMIHGDGLRLFREFLTDGAADAVHVYFPDPWWKRRHRKRRVLNEDLATNIQRVLSPGGKLHFWTDVKEYFDASLKLLAAETTLDGPHERLLEGFGADSPWRTHFDRRMALNGEPVYRAEYLRP